MEDSLKPPVGNSEEAVESLAAEESTESLKPPVGIEEASLKPPVGNQSGGLIEG